MKLWQMSFVKIIRYSWRDQSPELDSRTGSYMGINQESHRNETIRHIVLYSSLPKADSRKQLKNVTQNAYCFQVHFSNFPYFNKTIFVKSSEIENYHHTGHETNCKPIFLVWQESLVKKIKWNCYALWKGTSCESHFFMPQLKNKQRQHTCNLHSILKYTFKHALAYLKMNHCPL